MKNSNRMRKITFYFLILFCLPFQMVEMVAQCPSTSITLNTQNEIDSFSINFPNCTDLDKSLTIDGTNSNITSLSGLSPITSVGRDLTIEATQIVNLDGLNNLTALGEDLFLEDNPLLDDLQALSNLGSIPRALSIKNNDALTDLSVFSNLNYLQYLTIAQNDLLSDLSGFQSLDTIELNLWIYENGNITDLTGFSSLTSLGNLTLGTASTGNSSSVQNLNGLQSLTSLDDFSVLNSNELTSLQGLDNVTQIRTLTFWGVSPLTNLNGLGSLDTINSLRLTFCYDLQSLEGLNNLDVVSDVLLLAANEQLTNLNGLNNLQSTRSLQINVNESLTSLNGLANLTHIDSTLRMHGNENLIDISAIQNTNIDSIGLLRITDNPVLSVCNYDNICDYLTNGGTSSISGNNVGCANQADVFDACISAQNNTRLQGNIWTDFDLDCAQSPDDAGIPKTLMYIQGSSYSYTFTTDSAGFYNVPVLAGDYFLTVLTPSNFWIPCDTSLMITATGTNDTINTDFFLQPQGDCSYVDWFMNMNGLRICGTRAATIDLCNNGVQTAENVLITIDLGDFVTLDSSSVDFTTNADGTILFALDSLEIFECTSIDLTLFTDCDSVEINDQLCVDVSLMTDDICAPDSLWDGSNTNVVGSCDGDSIYFLIENTGTGDMLAPADFRVDILIEDVVLIYDNGNYQLESGETLLLSYPTIGTGFYMEIDQAMGHPIPVEATASVPNCQDILNNTLTNLFPNNNGDPFNGVFCTFAVNSFDPNIKSALPIGTGEEHFIEDNWELNYTIQFQNTGNDVAFDVVIKDTISEHLDLNTLQVRGGSHNFTWEINEERELVFTFANILLPDSTSNEPESHGMVSYSIYPYQDLTPLTRIENRAGIYFDFNEPIITNTVFHTIRKPVFSSIEQLDWCAGTPFNGVPINQDTTVIQLTEYVEYDSVQLFSLEIVDILNVVETVEIPIGEYFQNIEINGDTIISFEHTSNLGCDSIVTFQVTALTVGVNDLENPFQEVKVFPNPVTELLFIDASKMGETQRYTLTNTLGILVWEKTITPFQSLESINLNKIPAGIYWLEGKTNKERMVWKIIVNPQ